MHRPTQTFLKPATCLPMSCQVLSATASPDINRLAGRQVALHKSPRPQSSSATSNDLSSYRVAPAIQNQSVNPVPSELESILKRDLIFTREESGPVTGPIDERCSHSTVRSHKMCPRGRSMFLLHVVEESVR